MTTVKNIYDFINSIAPFDSQEEWDNSGHLVGDFRKEVKRVVMALDATKFSAQYAADINADLLLTHHPIIFDDLKNVMSDTPVHILANNDIACLCAHTNFDRASEGINNNLAMLLNLKNIRFICDGFVAVGELESPMSIDDLVEFVNEKLDVSGLRYTDTSKVIQTLAVGGGACSEFMYDALSEADCFLTGDLKYHEMLDASEQNFAVISAGHFETENKPFLMLKNKLEQIFTDVEFVVSPYDNPIKTLE